MTQSNPNVAVALEAIAEGLDILHLLACATNNTKWINDSMSLDKLNELARSLGYDDAQSVHTQVEGDRQDKMNNRFLDIYKCYTKVGQLRRELAQCHTELAAVGAALDVEKSAHRGSVLIADDVVNEMRQEVKQLQIDLKLNTRALAELRAERQLWRKWAHLARARRLINVGVQEALDECQVERNYDDGKPASARTRIFWLSRRAERAEVLAQLVTPELAALLGQLSRCTQPNLNVPGPPALHPCTENHGAARALAARIRKALVLEEHK